MSTVTRATGDEGLALRPVQGAGGGGGGGKDGGGGGSRTPTTAADNLNSTQYAQIIDLISEGEIQGLKDGLKSIYFDKTPIQNPDGTYNFQNVTIETRNGTQNQALIPFATSIEDERSVGVTVRADGPVTRTITDSQTDAVRLTISVPRLERITNEGDTVGESFSLAISVQYNGGGFTTVITDTISGRTGDLYQRDYLVNLTGAFPADIRITRLTADSNDLRQSNSFTWTSYTEIIYARLNYPNSALVGIRVDAEQFSNIPSRSYRVRGIKVAIPSNGTVDSTNGRITYSGVWNGTFGAAQWTTDPAWILWDLLTARYGFGGHINASQLDKWAFYSASQYASELVPDGYGGYEPRFSCNTVIQTAEEAYKLINDLCSVFRTMPYWAAGAMTISQDKPQDPAYLFTLANVSEEGFSYSSSSLKIRSNVAVVSYLDLDLQDTVFEVVEDAAAIAKYGVTKTEISAFACTSRGQAHRLGEWLLYAEQNTPETVNFTASIDAGVIVRPGQIIEVADPVKAGSRRGGRISAATTTTVTADDTTGLPASGGELSVILPDGTVQKRPVISLSSNVFTVSAAFSTAPNTNSVWAYENNTIASSTWRVVGVEEVDGAQYRVSALAYNASSYDYIERDQPLVVRDITDLNIIPEAPTNLVASEVLYDAGGVAKSKFLVSWQPSVGVQQYQFRWRQRSGNWSTARINRVDYEILDTTPAVYEIEVYAVGTNLRQSTLPARLTTQAFGKTAPPSDVTGTNLLAGDELNGVLSWDRATDLDVVLGGKVLIRHSNVLVGATWEDSQEIVPAAAGSQTQKLVPILEGTYLLKFEDDSGNRSLNATLVVVDLPTPQPRLLVQSYAEDALTPPFPGDKAGMLYSAEHDGLMIDTGQRVDDMAPDGNFDALPSIDSVGGVNPVGEYIFSSVYDMGAVFDVNIRRRFVTRALLPGALWDDNLVPIDAWPEIDENNLDRVNARLYVRTTDDNPAGTPTYGAWNECANVITRGRGFQFKTVATSADASVNILIDQLGAELELQQRTEQSAVISSGAAPKAVTFANAFYSTPNIGITANNMATGDYFVLSSTSRTGFTVEFKNSGGASVSRNFSYAASGYGKQV